MLTLGIVLIAASVGLLLWAVLSQVEEKATMRASLRQLDGYEVANVRDQELLRPVTQRAIEPLLTKLIALGRKISPIGYTEKTRRKFVSLGHTSTTAFDRFMAFRVVGLLLVPFAFILVFGVLGMGGIKGILMFGILAFAIRKGPDAVLSRRVEERKHEIRVALPDVLDLLVISVEAGLGFEQSLDRTVSAVPGALTDEFSRMLGEVRAGAGRGDAMRNMEARCDVAELRSFVLAIIQADTFGVSIGRVLRSQAEEMRVKRKQLAQEQAQKAPVKMLIPMVFCVFPAIFVVVLGPAIINISEGFAG